MNRKEQISFFKSQLASAEIRLSLASQIKAEATQSKVEATRALELLGTSPGRTRKGDVELKPEAMLRLVGNLTIKEKKTA